MVPLNPIFYAVFCSLQILLVSSLPFLFSLSFPRLSLPFFLSSFLVILPILIHKPFHSHPIHLLVIPHPNPSFHPPFHPSLFHSPFGLRHWKAELAHCDAHHRRSARIGVLICIHAFVWIKQEGRRAT